jgi:hypothetical protein
LGGIDGDLQPSVHLALTNHIAHPLRAQSAIVLWLFFGLCLKDWFAHDKVPSPGWWSTEVYHWRSVGGNCILDMTRLLRVPCSRERQSTMNSPATSPLA